jgi:hypothetical protein
MTTIKKMIERVLLNLEGYSGESSLYGTLSSGITSTDTEFTIDGPSFADGSGFTAGLLELGTELVWAQTINRNDTSTIYSNVIRGFKGTTAQNWNANTIVKSNPRFPVSSVLDAINDTIKTLYPRILAVTDFEFTGIGGQIQYKVPKGCLQVLQARWLPSSSTKAWAPIKKWSYTNFAGSNAPAEEFGMFDNKTIDIFAPISGRPIQIVYVTEPTTFEITELEAEYYNTTTEQVEIRDRNFTDTNLPEWAEEIIIFGACWRLASFVDSSRLQQTTAEQSLINSSGDARSNTSGSALARYFLGMFEQSIQLGMQRQSKELPTTIHKI